MFFIPRFCLFLWRFFTKNHFFRWLSPPLPKNRRSCLLFIKILKFLSALKRISRRWFTLNQRFRLSLNYSMIQFRLWSFFWNLLGNFISRSRVHAAIFFTARLLIYPLNWLPRLNLCSRSVPEACALRCLLSLWRNNRSRIRRAFKHLFLLLADIIDWIFQLRAQLLHFLLYLLYIRRFIAQFADIWCNCIFILGQKQRFLFWS